MVFCNEKYEVEIIFAKGSHNPYFNRWFSAILYGEYAEYVEERHNPYFNRWFSAM